MYVQVGIELSCNTQRRTSIQGRYTLVFAYDVRLLYVWKLLKSYAIVHPKLVTHKGCGRGRPLTKPGSEYDICWQHITMPH